ncbi:unnamed protein product [Euphydryas editha]|uniref:Uncharacterized protein n=1 Tax=Euphydryas editha TaxID=104508 RepID=A0AAU9TEK5_EUPED|nr:unnamed protein product [Euphydryas editha]
MIVLQVAQAAECARAAELRAQVAKHNALEQAARRDARAQCHKLLEEIKSKERAIIQLKREAARAASNEQPVNVPLLDVGSTSSTNEGLKINPISCSFGGLLDSCRVVSSQQSCLSVSKTEQCFGEQ